MNFQKHIMPIYLICLLYIFVLVHMIIPIGSSRCLSTLNITSVSPNSYGNHTPTEILIYGSGFTLDSEVHLYQSNLGQAVIEDTPGKAYDNAVSGDYAYVADLEKGSTGYRSQYSFSSKANSRL